MEPANVTLQTAAQRKEFIDSFYRPISDVMNNLAQRWTKEKNYENFKEYETVMRTAIEKHAPKGTKFIKGSKNPFGCTISVPTLPYDLQILGNGWRARNIV
jgi:hypothetical protein